MSIAKTFVVEVGDKADGPLDVWSVLLRLIEVTGKVLLLMSIIKVLWTMLTNLTKK